MVAKKAAKKSAKKVAKKTAKKVVKTNISFEMSKRSEGNAVREVLTSSAIGSKKIAASYTSLAHLSPSFIPFGDLPMQAITGLRGWIPGTFYEIIGPDGVGKSTMVFHLMGDVMEQGILPYLIQVQNKQLREDWIKRCLSSDPVKAESFYNNLFVDRAFTMSEAIVLVDNFCRRVRKELPHMASRPIGIFLDSFGFLMPPDMAAGVVEYGDNKKEKKVTAKELEKLPNFAAAKLSHLWKQRLNYLLHKHNAFMVVVEDQNDNIDMTGKTAHLPAYMQPTDDTNRTKRGGRAFNVLAAAQWVLVDHGNHRENKEVTGRRIRMTAVKTTYGEKNAYSDYVLRTRGYEDEEGSQQRVIDFSVGTADLLKNNTPQLAITEKEGLYTSSYFGVSGVSAHELVCKFRSMKELSEWVGAAMNIYGYDTAKLIQEKPISDEDVEGLGEGDLDEESTEGEQFEEEAKQIS